jgi:small subunit ribosomal protein S6
MTRYELLYIIPATHAETELQPVIDSVTSVLTKFGAKIVRNDMVGKLKLAYPVSHIRHGYYVIVDMDVEPAKVTEIDNALRLNTDVIRHQLMVKDPKVKPVFKIASVEDIERDKARGVVAHEATRRQAAAAPKSDKKVEVNLADLDQKLDNIVEGKIL